MTKGSCRLYEPLYFHIHKLRAVFISVSFFFSPLKGILDRPEFWTLPDTLRYLAETLLSSYGLVEYT